MSEGASVVCLHAVVAAAGPGPDAEGPGLPGGGPARPTELVEGLWLVSSVLEASPRELEAALGDLDRVSVCALAHERVVERCLAWGTVLPMKLFTFFSDLGRARADVLARREEILAAMQRVAGCREWSVRVRLEPERVREDLERRAAAAPATSGTDFLRKKAAVRGAGRDLAERAKAEAEEIFRGLRERAADAVRREVPAEPGAPLLLDGVLLVSEERREAFEGELQAAGARAANACAELVVSGPWPPYHFTAAREEPRDVADRA